MSMDYISRYVSWMKERSPDFGNLDFAVDCSCGMASLLVHRLFPSAHIINDVLDGRFPAHSPNPLNPQAREQLSDLVREKKLDCGVIFDGDADRCMFVDEHGDFVQCDYLIPLVAKGVMRGSSLEGEKVIHDIRTSRGAIEAMKELGAQCIMVPVGHAFAKPALRQTQAVCGGELAGHYYFREFNCCDSGILAALLILGEIASAKRKGLSFSQLMSPISGRYANSGELNYRIEDKDMALKRVLESAKANLGEEIARSDIDGVRVEYNDGWFNVRKSNTEPYLRMIIECDSLERLSKWRKILESALYLHNTTSI